MSADALQRIAARYVDKAKTAEPEEAFRLLGSFIAEAAADAACAVYLAVQHEAETCVPVENWHALDQRLQVKQVLAGCDFVGNVNAILGIEHPEDRAHIGQLAAFAYQSAFDNLVRTARPGGRA